MFCVDVVVGYCGVGIDGVVDEGDVMVLKCEWWLFGVVLFDKDGMLLEDVLYNVDFVYMCFVLGVVCVLCIFGVIGMLLVVVLN